MGSGTGPTVRPSPAPDTGPDAAVTVGETMFARYAYPPNELGYCGPGDGRDLLEFAHAAAAPDPPRTVAPGRLDVATRARGFDGAWPYLRYLAEVARAESIMDPQVVEAYWIGNELLDGIDPASFSRAVTDAFAGQSGADWGALGADVFPRPVPHHSFHVFSVYPWVGLLRRTGSSRALHVLDSCRIRWGRVDWVRGESVQVQSQQLTWDGTAIRLGAPRPEQARYAAGGHSLAAEIRSGDWVALHWDWVCDQLTGVQLKWLRDVTLRQLAITNREACRSD